MSIADRCALRDLVTEATERGDAAALRVLSAEVAAETETAADPADLLIAELIDRAADRVEEAVHA